MIANILSYFRIKDWLHLLGLALLGYVYNPGFDLFSIKLPGILLLSFSLLAFAYSFSTQFKLHWGKENFKIRIIPSLAVLTFALSYSLFLSFDIFILSLISIIVVIVYVVPPFALKSVPITVTVLNSAGFTAHFLLGAAIVSDLSKELFMLAIYVAVILLAVQLVHEIAHFAKDKADRRTTTPIRFGFKTTSNTIYVLLIILTLWAVFLTALQGFHLLFSIATILFSLLFFLIIRFEKDAVKARMNVRYLSIAIGIALLLMVLFRI